MNGSNHVSYGKALPDFHWISTNIPVVEVAKRLGIQLRGKKATCPNCRKLRLTFTTKLNGWRCWNCDPGGRMHGPVDLVTQYRGCSPYEAAVWISERWNVAGRIQVERTENARGTQRQMFKRYRQIPVSDRSKPSCEAFVASPGWREMSVQTRAIAMTLLSIALHTETPSFEISRSKLGCTTGIHRSNTIARANKELEAIGLFAIDRGYSTQAGTKLTSYRLTWWSEAFQNWLLRGYALDNTVVDDKVRNEASSPDPIGQSTDQSKLLFPPIPCTSEQPSSTYPPTPPNHQSRGTSRLIPK
jgi:hypothetical protein